MNWLKKIFGSQERTHTIADRRKELAQQIETVDHWKSYTVGYLGIAFTNDSAASKAFEVLRRSAHPAGLDVVVVRGSLRDSAGRSHLTFLVSSA